MYTMTPSNQADILSAWKAFTATGVLLEDKVRPSVARSWKRCRDHRLDPWSTTYPKCSNSLLIKKRARYSKILSMASPIMNYALTLLDNNISICDAEGFVFELITPLKNYPRTLGTFVTEATCGNGAVTISLKEHIPYRTDGYEHYRVISHTCSGASSPIFNKDKDLIGVLNCVNPFGALPDKSLPMMISAAKAIELLLTAEKQERLAIYMKCFKEMIDCCSHSVVVLDGDGTVIAANEAFARLLGYINSNDIIKKSFGDYLLGKQDLSNLMQSGPEQHYNLNVSLKGTTTQRDGTVINCKLIRKNTIRLINDDDVQHVLLFESLKDSAVNNTPVVAINFRHAKLEEVDYIGESSAWAKVHDMVLKAARFPSNVLLQGETGTGKEVVAKAIHRLSNRKGPFVAINCGAIPKDLLYSELFGYERGAFTGAQANGYIGKFEYAHQGTLFLDEIGEMPLDMQTSLLRFTQDQVVTRIGSNKPKKVDVRIIAATNRDLVELVRNGRFREDLYYRLNVIDIRLPPLRERKSDIPLLAQYFATKFSEQFNLQPDPISEDILELLCRYEWPGNVRELKNVIEKALVLSGGKAISPEVITDLIIHRMPFPPEAKESYCYNNITKYELIQLLQRYNYNISRTAKALHVARNTLYRMIEKHNIKLRTSVINDDNIN